MTLRQTLLNGPCRTPIYGLMAEMKRQREVVTHLLKYLHGVDFGVEFATPEAGAGGIISLPSYEGVLIADMGFNQLQDVIVELSKKVMAR